MVPTKDHWLAVAKELNVQVTAPYKVTLDGKQIVFAAYFQHFGSSCGIVIDSDWSVIGTHADALSAAGFGYSCVSFERGTDLESLREVLVDWGWTGPPEDKPEWA
jgi:hypothetical protein